MNEKFGSDESFTTTSTQSQPLQKDSSSSAWSDESKSHLLKSCLPFYIGSLNWFLKFSLAWKIWMWSNDMRTCIVDNLLTGIFRMWRILPTSKWNIHCRCWRRKFFGKRISSYGKYILHLNLKFRTVFQYFFRSKLMIFVSNKKTMLK